MSMKEVIRMLLRLLTTLLLEILKELFYRWMGW